MKDSSLIKKSKIKLEDKNTATNVNVPKSYLNRTPKTTTNSSNNYSKGFGFRSAEKEDSINNGNNTAVTSPKGQDVKSS